MQRDQNQPWRRHWSEVGRTPKQPLAPREVWLLAPWQGRRGGTHRRRGPRPVQRTRASRVRHEQRSSNSSTRVARRAPASQRIVLCEHGHHLVDCFINVLAADRTHRGMISGHSRDSPDRRVGVTGGWSRAVTGSRGSLSSPARVGSTSPTPRLSNHQYVRRSSRGTGSRAGRPSSIGTSGTVNDRSHFQGARRGLRSRRHCARRARTSTSRSTAPSTSRSPAHYGRTQGRRDASAAM
jgi:hypothetical protein